MKKTGIVGVIFFLLGILLQSWSNAYAASDGYYNLTETGPAWDGTAASRLKSADSDNDYSYGDDDSITFNLPWNFRFYGQTYSGITADTNGNIWFTASDAAYAFNLSTTGRGPVISAWNNDLSSAFQGSVFIQHKTNPERVVIEWQAETYTEEGLDSPNNFEIVIFPDGTIRFDYNSFTTQSGDDAGSGISRGDGSASLNLTTLFGNAFSLAGRSFQYTPQALITLSVAKEGAGTGTITSTPSALSCGTKCNAVFDQGATVTLIASPDFGSVFNTWSGACNGTGTCTLSMDAAKSVTATFAQTPLPAVTITSPSGTITNNKPVLSYNVSRGTAVAKIDGLIVTTLSGAALDALADGPHVVRVESTDSSDTMGYAESTFVIDTTSPTAASITPANGSSNVPVRAAVLVRFSEQIDPAAVTAGMVTLVSQAGQVPGVVSISGDGTSLIFKPQNKLAYGTMYTFTLKAGVRDVLGNTQSSDLVTSFSTPFLDPDLVGYWPMDGNWTDYSGNGNKAESYGSSAFSDGRSPGVSAATFVIDSKNFAGSGAYVPATTQYLASAPNTFTISFWANPTATRNTTSEASDGISGQGGQRYAIAPVVPDIAGAGAGVSVGTNGISIFENNGDNVLTTSYMPSLLVYDAPTPLSGWNQITVVYTNKQPSLYLNGQYIKTGQTSHQSTIYPSAVFADTSTGYGAYSGQLEEVAVYKRPLSAQEIQTLYQDSSRQPPQISITSPSQTVKCKPGEVCSATVTASAPTGLKKLYCSATGAASSNGPVMYFDSPQVRITQQMTFQVAQDAAPYDSYQLSCTALTAEGVLGAGDIQLQVEDVVPPTVVASTPADNAIDVSATMPVTITFSEPMDKTSVVSKDTFKFQRADNGAFVTGIFGFSSDNRTLIAIPSPALDASTSYVIAFSGVRDLAGNALTNEYSLRFTTLQQTSLTLDDKGTQASPYVLPPSRYGTLTLNNTHVSVSGAITADNLVITNSAVNVSTGALGTPGNLSTAYGDMQVSGSTVTVNGEVAGVCETA